LLGFAKTVADFQRGTPHAQCLCSPLRIDLFIEHGSGQLQRATGLAIDDQHIGQLDINGLAIAGVCRLDAGRVVSPFEKLDGCRVVAAFVGGHTPAGQKCGSGRVGAVDVQAGDGSIETANGVVDQTAFELGLADDLKQVDA